MTFRTLVVKCPNSDTDLEVGPRLPVGDPSDPTRVRLKSLSVPVTIHACPICGEMHSFSQGEEVREVKCLEDTVGVVNT